MAPLDGESFALLSEMVGGAVVLIGPAAIVTLANERALALLGEGAGVGQQLSPEWAERFGLDALERGESVEERAVRFEAQGRSIHLMVNARALPSSGALVYARENTLEVERETRMRAMIEERGRFVRNMNALTLRVGADRLIRSVVADAPGPWARPNVSKEGEPIESIEPAGLARAIASNWDEEVSEGGVRTFRHRELGVGGAIECEVRLFRAGSGRLVHVIDRTEERRIEDQLIVAQHCVDRAIDPIYWIGQDARMMYANRAAVEVYGARLVGRSYVSIASEFETDDWRELWRELGDGAGVRFMSSHRRADGSSYPVDLGASLATDASGTSLVCLVARDVSQRVEAERVAEARALSLVRSNEAFQEFAYVASHDLQEPLRKIVAFGHRIKKGADSLDERGADYLDRMQRAASRMSRLINDLLQFSRVTTQPHPFERCDFESILREVVEDLEILAEEKGASIAIDVERAVVEADPIQLGQILMNLVANAIKFSHPDRAPRVQIRGEHIRQDPKSGVDVPTYQFEVEDNGIGFEPRYADRIFGAFQRLHARTSEYQGTGIGLAICRKIVERHRGTIWVESSPGEGATFYVRLPIEQPDDGTPETQNAP